MRRSVVDTSSGPFGVAVKAPHYLVIGKGVTVLVSNTCVNSYGFPNGTTGERPKLIIERGARLFVGGTKLEPVVFKGQFATSVREETETPATTTK